MVACLGADCLGMAMRMLREKVRRSCVYVSLLECLCMYVGTLALWSEEPSEVVAIFRNGSFVFSCEVAHVSRVTSCRASALRTHTSLRERHG